MLAMALYTHGLEPVAEAKCPPIEVLYLALHLQINCFDFQICSPIPFSSKFVMASQLICRSECHKADIGDHKLQVPVPNIIIMIASVLKMKTHTML